MIHKIITNLKKNSDEIILVLVLFLLFNFNLFHTVGTEFFHDFQEDSESLVIRRLYADAQFGLFSFGRFLCDGSAAYTSQIGLQGMVFSLLNMILPFSIDSNIAIFRGCNSLLLAIVLARIFLFLKKEFGKSVLSVLLISTTIGMPFLVSMGRNLYWVPFVFFLPLLCMFHFYQENGKFIKDNSFTLKAKCLIFLVVFVKCAAGYEFISTILIAGCIPIIYYAILRKNSYEKFFCQLKDYTIVTLAAFFTSLCVHLIQNYLFFGSWGKAIHALGYIIAKRTTDVGISLSTEYMDSLQASVFKVVIVYFRAPSILASLLIIFFIIIQFILKHKKSDWYFSDRKLMAAGAACIVAFIAPMSWFILAKGHSFVHTHINFVLWDIPFTLFFSSFTVYLFSEYIITKRNKKIILSLAVLISLCVYLVNMNIVTSSTESKKNFMVFAYGFETLFMPANVHTHEIQRNHIVTMQENPQMNQTTIKIIASSFNWAKLEISEGKLIIDGTAYKFSIQLPVKDQRITIVCDGLVADKIKKNLQLAHKAY